MYHSFSTVITRTFIFSVPIDYIRPYVKLEILVKHVLDDVDDCFQHPPSGPSSIPPSIHHHRSMKRCRYRLPEVSNSTFYPGSYTRQHYLLASYGWRTKQNRRTTTKGSPCGASSPMRRGECIPVSVTIL